MADVTQPCAFGTGFDLVTFSLVLEHIEHLSAILIQASRVLGHGGHLCIGELHPYKQYAGSQARFDTAEGRQHVPAYRHHVSEFVTAGLGEGLSLVEMKEWFDHEGGVPRILSLLFRQAA